MMNLEMPKPKYRLIIQNGLVICEYHEKHRYPCALRRFLYWIILGWKFEEIEE